MRPVNTNQVVRQERAIQESLVNAIGLTWEIGVVRTDYNPSMRMHPCMELDEVPAIACQHSSVLTDGKRQDIGVGYLSAGIPRLANREDVMAELPQLLDDRFGKVLIGVE